jgi:hypothetical protein
MTTTRSTLPEKNNSLIKNYRLPKRLKPYFYDITIKTTFNILTEPDLFDGEIFINFTCIERTNSVIFHKKQLNITSVSVKFEAIEYSLHSTSYDEETEIFNVTLSQMLEIGNNYSISMSYHGKFLNNNIGFYKNFYLDSNDTKK